MRAVSVFSGSSRAAFKSSLSSAFAQRTGAVSCQCNGQFLPLALVSVRHFPKMHFKSYRRPTLPRGHPRIARFAALKRRQKAKRKQPVEPVRIKPDRPREDKDPDPFGYKLEPESIYKPHVFEEWPLHPGIRPDQLRHGFTADDLVACGVTDADDFKLISRALSHHNSNGREIKRQLLCNEIVRWRRHELDCGNMEIKICTMTLKLRCLKKNMIESSRDKQAAERFNQIYQKRRKLMQRLRDVDFGRYKKVMTYLGLRDRFNPSVMSPGVNKMSHVHSKKKPPGGRRGHMW